MVHGVLLTIHDVVADCVARFAPDEMPVVEALGVQGVQLGVCEVTAHLKLLPCQRRKK